MPFKYLSNQSTVRRIASIWFSRFCKSMAFVRIVMRVHSLAVFPEQIDDLYGFFFRHARIVITLQNQQRSLYVVDVS